MTDVYGAQVRAQLAQAQRELSAARATIEAQQREALKTAARLRAAEAELAVLQQRYDDEHATAVERAHETERVRKQLRAAEARIAAVRALADDISTVLAYEGPRHAHIRPGVWDDTGRPCDHCALVDRLRSGLAAVDGSAEKPAAPPQFAPTVAPEPVRPPTFAAAVVLLTERARAEYLAEQQRLEHDITTRIEAAGLTVVRTDPVEQAAAHPAAIRRLRTEVFRHSLPSSIGGQVWQITGLPCIPDESLPPGEVHLRPHPRPAEQPAVCCMCGSTDVVYRNYREQPFCCPCAQCCPSSVDGPS